MFIDILMVQIVYLQFNIVNMASKKPISLYKIKVIIIIIKMLIFSQNRKISEMEYSFYQSFKSRVAALFNRGFHHRNFLVKFARFFNAAIH